MADEKTQRAMIFRVVEWGTYMELQQDAMIKQLKGVNGETGVEVSEGERLADLEVVALPQPKHISRPDPDNPGRFINQEVKVVVMRATFARVVEGPIPDDVVPETNESIAKNNGSPEAAAKGKLEMPPGYKGGEG